MQQLTLDVSPTVFEILTRLARKYLVWRPLRRNTLWYQRNLYTAEKYI